MPLNVMQSHALMQPRTRRVAGAVLFAVRAACL